MGMLFKVKGQSAHISVSIDSQSPSYHVPNIFSPPYFIQTRVITITPLPDIYTICHIYTISIPNRPLPSLV